MPEIIEQSRLSIQVTNKINIGISISSRVQTLQLSKNICSHTISQVILYHVTKVAVKRNSHEKQPQNYSCLFKKLKTTSVGVPFHCIFRRETLSFENELLHNFLFSFFRFFLNEVGTYIFLLWIIISYCHIPLSY